MEIQGKIFKILEKISGEGRFGTWVKQSFVIETEEEYPKKVCFDMFGDDKVRLLNTYKEGDEVNVSFNPDSREYEGRWYTNLRAWKLETVSANPENENSAKEEATNLSETQAEEKAPEEEKEDLPF